MSSFSPSPPLVIIVLFVTCFIPPTSSSLYTPLRQIIKYHNGPLLHGNIPISILWYGHFSPSQKAIINDFILSLTSFRHHDLLARPLNSAPSVFNWWKTVDTYLQKAGKNIKNTHVYVSMQISDPLCSMGKSLTRSQIAMLGTKFGGERSHNGLALILTAEDVTVESFCMAVCGLHSSRGKQPYIWVGNSASQCPGQCAWPFHEPMFGPRGTPLGAPNGDVGMDGMIINSGTLLAGAVTNPFGNGFFEGEAGAPIEVAGACPGVYGPGAYPGYAGQLRVDSLSGGSYNVVGVRRRKYLVPAMLGPDTSTCSPMV